MIRQKQRRLEQRLSAGLVVVRSDSLDAAALCFLIENHDQLVSVAKIDVIRTVPALDGRKSLQLLLLDDLQELRLKHVE